MYRQFRGLPAIDVVAPLNSLYGDVYAVPAAVANRKVLSISIEYSSSEGDGDIIR